MSSRLLPAASCLALLLSACARPASPPTLLVRADGAIALADDVLLRPGGDIARLRAHLGAVAASMDTEYEEPLGLYLPVGGFAVRLAPDAAFESFEPLLGACLSEGVDLWQLTVELEGEPGGSLPMHLPKGKLETVSLKCRLLAAGPFAVWRIESDDAGSTRHVFERVRPRGRARRGAPRGARRRTARGAARSGGRRRAHDPLRPGRARGRARRGAPRDRRGRPATPVSAAREGAGPPGRVAPRDARPALRAPRGRPSAFLPPRVIMSGRPSGPMSERIRDLLSIRARPTVVQLAHLETDDAGWISESWCTTAVVAAQLTALRAALERPTGTGAFLVGQYGAGKSHFLAYVAQRLRAGELTPAEQGAPEVTALSLLHYAAEHPLEEIVGRALGLERTHDRRDAWAAVQERHPGGLVLLVDELSEFLRSKADARAFTEDVRFLQFLGEWAQQHRFFVVCGMQEQIEHVGELDRALYRKIKDRFPLRMLLSPAHVRELLQEGLFEKRDGFDGRARELADEVLAALPPGAGKPGRDALAALYPVHPATLDLLEEVRDRFSQARGVVDFAVTRLAGSEERGVAPFLDQPWGEWLTPDAIVDHFRDLFELQAEFVPIAQLVLAHYERHLDALFDKPKQRELADRLLKLLVLVHLSPSRARLTPDEAAAWLFVRASRIDVAKNVAVVTRVLDHLAREGRYVVADGHGFRLDLGESDAARLGRELERAVAELEPLGDAVLDRLAPLLRGRRFDPFVLPRDEPEHRAVAWHFHERRYVAYLGEGDARAADEPTLVVRLPWGDSTPALGLRTLRPARIEPAPRHRELAAAVELAQRSWSEATATKLRERVERGTAAFEEEVFVSFQRARAVDANGLERPARTTELRAGFEGWLAAQAEEELRGRFPSFERFAPCHGPLSRDALERFARFVVEHDVGAESTDDAVALVREAYLVPMGLLSRRGRTYEVPKSAARNELVQLVLPLVEHAPPPRSVADRLAQPVYGLVPDQVRVLLLFLLGQGELDLTAGGKPYRESLDMRPDPLTCERVTPGRGLAPEAQRALGALCAELDVRAPDSWTALLAKRAVRDLAARGRGIADELNPLLFDLAGAEGTASLRERVEAVLTPWRELEEGGELEAFERFLRRIGPVARFADELRTVRALPGRLQRLMEGLRRHAHLLAQPALARAGDEALRARVEELGAAPAIERVEEAERWLGRAAALYREYAEDYQRRHDAWWAERREHPAWRYRVPALARSRHVGVEGELAALERARARARELFCDGVGDLAFRPVCACGFGADDGIETVLADFERARDAVERELARFFERDDVRRRVREWVDEGLEADETTLAYAQGSVPLPGIEDVALLDRHLLGLELVRRVSLGHLAPALAGRTLEPDAAVRAFTEFLEQLGAGRVRFEGPTADAGVDPRVARWCVEQALAHGVALPEGLEALGDVPLDPAAVSAAALARLEALGLPRELEERVLAWMLEGKLAASASGGPLSAAIRALSDGVVPSAPGLLAAEAARAYAAHARLERLGGERWRAWLDGLADAALDPEPPPLAEVLRARAEEQWLVVDCLGAPLVAALEERLAALFAPWRVAGVEHALAPRETTTDAFYRELTGAGLARKLVKLDAIDQLVHGRDEPFDDLARLALAELEIGWRRVVEELDAARPVLLFADHGFRLAADGRGYGHGGPSTLERLVPLVSLAPRK